MPSRNSVSSFAIAQVAAYFPPDVTFPVPQAEGWLRYAAQKVRVVSFLDGLARNQPEFPRRKRVNPIDSLALRYWPDFRVKNLDVPHIALASGFDHMLGLDVFLTLSVGRIVLGV